MSEELEEVEEFPEPEPIPAIPCPTCFESGKVLSGWDEEGNDIYSDCYFCGGDGLL